MTQKTRTFLLITLHILVALCGLMALIGASIAAKDADPSAELGLSLAKTLSIAFVGYGTTRAWLIFKHRARSQKA